MFTPPNIAMLCAILLGFPIILLQHFGICQSPPYPFLLQCHRSDPHINRCLLNSANHLVRRLRAGIPEIGFTKPEPIVIDEIGISLGSGPDGYRSTFTDIEAFGVSNLTVVAVRSDVNSHQYQFTLYIPKINARAIYESKGILILVRATGEGDYWGEYRDIKCKIYIQGVPRHDQGGVTFFQLEVIKMDFSVKSIRMGVENVQNTNSVILAALNLFINSNSQELLKEMKPQLRQKLIDLLGRSFRKLFSRVPYDAWITD